MPGGDASLYGLLFSVPDSNDPFCALVGGSGDQYP